jgi:hypothetical protein
MKRPSKSFFLIYVMGLGVVENPLIVRIEKKTKVGSKLGNIIGVTRMEL